MNTVPVRIAMILGAENGKKNAKEKYDTTKPSKYKH